MTDGPERDSSIGALDTAFSEFSDPSLLPPSPTSINQIARMGRRLVAHTTPSTFIECALFNGDLGYTLDREEGDILHVVRQGEGAEASTRLTWYRRSFQNLFDSYLVSGGQVTGHNLYALAMSISNMVEVSDEEVDITELADEHDEDSISPKTAEVFEQVKAVTGLEDAEDLETAISTALVAYGTKTQQRRQHHQLKGSVPTQDSVNITMTKRQRAPHALQIAPKLILILDQLMATDRAFWKHDVLRLLENGSVEYESPLGRNRSSQRSTSFSDQVNRRAAAQEALLAERMLGLQAATQEQVDRVRNNLRGMLPWVQLTERH